MSADANNALRTWMTLAETEGQMASAIGAYRTLFKMIEGGFSPDWKLFNLTPGAFFGWGLQHVPERKNDGKNPVLSIKLADMTAASNSLAEHTAKYRALNESIASRPSSPPPRLRCPKCRMTGMVDFEAHVKRCRPWNTSTKEEQAGIEKSNASLLAPVHTPIRTSSNQHPQVQYGEAVLQLGLVQSRLVQAPPSQEIRALTSRARRLLDDIEAASAGL